MRRAPLTAIALLVIAGLLVLQVARRSFASVAHQAQAAAAELEATP